MQAPGRKIAKCTSPETSSGKAAAVGQVLHLRDSSGADSPPLAASKVRSGAGRLRETGVPVNMGTTSCTLP